MSQTKQLVRERLNRQHKAKSNGHLAVPRKTWPVVRLDDGSSDLDRLPFWKRHRILVVPYLHLVATILVAYINYLRYSYTKDAQRHLGFSWIPWLFLYAEIGTQATKCTNDILRLSVFFSRQSNRPKLRIVGDDVPTVDVIIVACGEDPSVAYDTVHAACVIDYPRHRYRVILSDDASDPRIEAEIRNLQLKYAHLHYYARLHRKGVHHGFKAGNINAAVRFSSSLPGGPAEFYAVLDVDMIPETSFLRALTANIANDPRVAMASVPQYFYNQPVNDPLLQSHMIGNKIDEAVRDTVNATWCSGTGFICRPEALAEVGGFSETTLAEDIFCSLTLYGKGWKVVYVQEQLQLGLVPPDLASHVKQRTKWHIGSMQNSLRLLPCLGGPLTKDMTLHQRLWCMAYCYNIWISSILRVPALFIFPICLFFDRDLILVDTPSQLQFLLCISFASNVLARFIEWLVSTETGYILLRQHEEGQLWMIPLQLYNMVREFLPLGWGGQRMGFTPSGSVRSVMNERNKLHRVSVWRRLRIMVSEYGMAFHIGMAVFTIAAITTSVKHSLNMHESLAVNWRAMIPRVLWPGMPWTQYVALLLPITYTLWPPTMPQRRQLMEQVPETKVWRPRMDVRGEQTDKWIWLRMIVPVVTFVLHGVACVLSFSWA